MVPPPEPLPPPIPVPPPPDPLPEPPPPDPLPEPPPEPPSWPGVADAVGAGVGVALGELVGSADPCPPGRPASRRGGTVFELTTVITRRVPSSRQRAARIQIAMRSRRSTFILASPPGGSFPVRTGARTRQGEGPQRPVPL